MRVLLVEHDAAMVRVLERGLRAHGLDVWSVKPTDAPTALAADDSVGIAVLDLDVTKVTTKRLLERIRTSRRELPLLFLAAGKSPTGLAPGDDFLEKPFAMEELIARIHARTRAPGQPRVTTLTAGDLRLDLLARCAWRGDRMIDLSGREFALLEYFMRHPGRVVPRPQILADVWGYHLSPSASNSNVVDVYVRYLRNRLRHVVDRSVIQTVRGAGYQFNPPQPALSVSRTQGRRPRRAMPAAAGSR